MSKKQVNHVIRAWKDPVYRSNLSAKERAQLPEHPAGMIELEDDMLKELVGGRWGCNTAGNNYSCTSIIINP